MKIKKYNECSVEFNNIENVKVVSSNFNENQIKELAKPAQKNNIEKLTKNDPNLNVIDDLKTCLKSVCAKESEKEKTAMRDLLNSLEAQIELEPQNIELRQAYEAIKSCL